MPAPTKSNAAMSPDGGAPQPAVPKTELQELQMKAGEVTDEVSYVYFYSSLLSINVYIYLNKIFFAIYNYSHLKVPEECWLYVKR